MNRYCRALAAGVAAACLGGAAQANDGTAYYYYDDGTDAAYSNTFAPSVRYYESNPVVVAPAPRVYYAPAYTVRSNTTYYYTGSNHDHYSLSSPGYTTYYERRAIAPAPPAATYYYTPPAYVAPARPYGYVPPGLSVTTPTGTYAPLYGGWNAYSSENVGGYDGYRTTTDY